MENQPYIKIYSADRGIRNKRRFVNAMINDLKSAQYLGFILAKRDIKSQYRQSFLGIIWAFINPIFNTLLWIFLNNTGVVQVNNTAIPYPAYVFVGTMLWGVFVESINSPLGQTNIAKNILSKVNFPKEAIVISGIYQTLFNGTIKIGLVVIAILALGIIPNWNILLFPIGLLSLIAIGNAVGLIITPIAMLYGDIQRILPIALQFGMYLTPVVFPSPKSTFLATIFQINPLTILIENSRNWLTGQTTVELTYFTIILVTSIVLLLVGLIFYRLAMPILVERMAA